jgi:hypothetical protein
MAATLKQLEKRIEQLEREVAELRELIRNGGRVKDWRAAVEKYAGDEDVLHVLRGAMKIREADRARARKRFAKEDLAAAASSKAKTRGKKNATK